MLTRLLLMIFFDFSFELSFDLSCQEALSSKVGWEMFVFTPIEESRLSARLVR
jgi:hypothetical protein